MRTFLLSLLLVFTSFKAMAIGDSGGCGRPSKSIEIATFGTPDEMQTLLEKSMAWQWQALSPGTQKLIAADERATTEWRFEAIRNFVDEPVGCSSGEWFLDHAVEGGNIEVIKWLLDQVANSSVGKVASRRSYENIFSRCPNARLDSRPDGLIPDQAKEKTLQAYKFLISKGADVNRPLNGAGSFTRSTTNALVHCLNDDMIPTLLLLGVNRSPQTFWDGNSQSKFDEHSTQYVPLQEAIWLALIGNRSMKRVEILAQGGFNDLRGTKIEGRLRDDCKKDENRDLCSSIGSLVLLSKGTIPWIEKTLITDAKNSKSIVSTRNTCAFPELQTYADHDFLAIAAIGEDVPAIEVSINNPGKPLFLYLESTQSKKWKIRYTSQTKIVGVVAASNGAVIDEVSGIDRSTPLYVGRDCSGSIDFRVGTPKIVRRTANSNFSDPFRKSDLPQPLIVEGYRVLAGSSIDAKRVIPTLSGRDALEDLVSKGKVFRGNSQIFSKWMAQEDRRWSLFKKRPKKVPPFWNSYVYPDYGQSWIDLPSGLKGVDAPVLFIYGNSELIGDRGDATIFFLTTSHNAITKNTGCVGPLC